MLPLPHTALRTAALIVILGAALTSPRPVEDTVIRADSRSGGATRVSDAATSRNEPRKGTSLPLATVSEEAPRCSVVVAYPDDAKSNPRVALTDLTADKDCPSELNTTVGLTFEVNNPKPGRNLWWRRAESSFDVLYPSSGSITSSGKSRVSLSNLVLDQTVTIDVLEGDQRLMSFTLKHF